MITGTPRILTMIAGYSYVSRGDYTNKKLLQYEEALC